MNSAAVADRDRSLVCKPIKMSPLNENLKSRLTALPRENNKELASEVKQSFR